MSDDPLYLLIHSPLVGPYTWIPVANALKEQGEAAIVPDIREHYDCIDPQEDLRLASVTSKDPLSEC